MLKPARRRADEQAMRTIRHRSTSLLIAVAVAASAPAGVAQAASYSVAAGAVPLAGPVVAGNRVVWLERRATGDVLVAAAEGVPAHDVAVLSHSRTQYVTLAAAGDRAVVGRSGVTLIDLTSGTASRVDTCLGAAGCRPCPDNVAPILSGSVLALADFCRERTAITDLDDGTIATIDGMAAVVGGTYAAVQEYEDRWMDDTVEVDWRTGRRIRSISPEVGSLDGADGRVALDPDGALVYFGENGVSVAPLPPARATRIAPAMPSPTDEDVSLDGTLATGGGLVAQRIEDDTSESIWPTFAVTGRDGSARRTLTGQREPRDSRWGFDGTHLAWVAQPCAQPVIQVWDLAGPPPASVPDGCAMPEVARRSIGYRRGSLRVPMTCPATATLDCAGTLSGSAPDAYLHDVRLPAGTTQTVALKVVSPRSLRGRRGFTVTLRIHGAERMQHVSSGSAEVRVTARSLT
jgi:hypothetical protein